MNKAQEIEIQADDDDIRLDRWFKRHYPSLPHAKLQQLLRKGAVKIDNKPATTAMRIKAKQVVRVPPFTTTPQEKPAPLKLSKKQKDELQSRVIYKNDELIVFNKPSGLAVQGGTKTGVHLDGLLDALTFEAEGRPRLVHRLDKDTSGALLLARTLPAAAKLTGYFRTHKIGKVYWALLSGVLPKEEGIIESEIDGKLAETAFRCVEEVSTLLSWVEFTPRTGRKHQLRIHADLLGAPIVGDSRYGKGGKLFGEPPQLHLHARSLTLPKGKPFHAPLPSHMASTWKKLGFILDS